MDEITGRIVKAYRKYFTTKWEEEARNILDNSKNLNEADNKLREKIREFDQAWDQVTKFYHLKEDEDD